MNNEIDPILKREMSLASQWLRKIMKREGISELLIEINRGFKIKRTTTTALKVVRSDSEDLK